MIILDDDSTTETKSATSTDTKQNIKLDSLQSAVDSLNVQIAEINTTLLALSNSIDDKYSAQTQTLLTALTNQIDSLSVALEASISTAQLNATYGNFSTLTATLSATMTELTASIAEITEKLTVKESEIETLNADSADIETLNANTANLETANINLLSVVSFTVNTLTAVIINADDVNAEKAAIGTIKNNKINTQVIAGKEWKTPISTPDNTELLHISIPKYKGIIQLQTEDDEFNLTIFNDSSITLNQQDYFIYRVERNDNTFDIYIKNVGNTVNYRILHVGSESFDSETSEIVDRTLYQQNIDQLHDVVFFETQGKIVKSNELGYLFGLTANIQEQLDTKQPKILENPVEMLGNTYYSVETLLEQISTMLVSMLEDDIVYREDIEALTFPYSSITYDSDTESITITGFRIDYIDGVLYITKID